MSYDNSSTSKEAQKTFVVKLNFDASAYIVAHIVNIIFIIII